MNDDRLFHEPKVILDTETTGISKSDEVIQLAIIEYEKGDILMNQYFRPKCEIAPEAMKVHGISMEYLADKPTIDEYFQQISELLYNNQVLIYNSQFDCKLLQQSFAVHHSAGLRDFQNHCVMKAYAEYFGEIGNYGNFRWQKLTNAVIQQDVDCDDLIAHNAVSDCEMTRRLIHKVGLQQMFSGDWK